MRKRGDVTKYWLHGLLWLGLYKRPIGQVTITIMFEATPSVLVLSNAAQEPDIQETYHAVIAEIASGLLPMKEGMPYAERGLQRIATALNLQQKKEGAA